MEYYKILHFKKEPFSNSPDPEIFFQSRQHMGCLQKLELSIRMRRGLNVVIGDVGTGKTTLCRQIIREFNKDERIESRLILDPHFSSPIEFLTTVVELLGCADPGKNATELQLKENIKNYLFKRGVDEDKVVILIIDEGQKLPEYCLEILREFLNYETNEHKLLQIVLFAQKELEKKIEAHQNFADRINLYHTLEPLNFEETRAMVQFRLDETSEDEYSPAFFNYLGLWVIYRATQGYPRKIVNLCHQILVNLIIKNRTKAGLFMAHACALKVFPERAAKWKRIKFGALAGIMAFLVIAGLNFGLKDNLFNDKDRRVATPAPPEEAVAALPATATPSPESQSPLEIISKTPVPTTRPEQPAAVDPKDNPPPGALVAANHSMPESASEPQKAETSQPKSQLDLKPGLKISTVLPAKIETPTLSQPVASEKIAAQSPSQLLGAITVRSGETLGDMIRKIYGPYSFNHKNTKTVLDFNNNLINPNKIALGNVIRFPNIPIQLTPMFSDVLWIKVGVEQELADAYRFLGIHKQKPPMLIIPSQDKTGKFEFTIILEKYFSDADSAKQTIAILPPELKTNATILNGLDETRYFFKPTR